MRIRQQPHAGRRRERIADQEVAIAGDERDVDAVTGDLAQARRDRPRERIVDVVVTSPVFEQVAEDEEATGTAGDPRVDEREEGVGGRGCSADRWTSDAKTAS